MSRCGCSKFRKMFLNGGTVNSVISKHHAVRRVRIGSGSGAALAGGRGRGRGRVGRSGCQAFAGGRDGPADVLRAQLKQGCAWVNWRVCMDPETHRSLISISAWLRKMWNCSWCTRGARMSWRQPMLMCKANVLALVAWMRPSDEICSASSFWSSIAIRVAELPDWFVQEHRVVICRSIFAC